MHGYRVFEPEQFILKCRQVPMWSAWLPSPSGAQQGTYETVSPSVSPRAGSPILPFRHRGSLDHIDTAGALPVVQERHLEYSEITSATTSHPLTFSMYSKTAF